jgi:hypothetical protein
MKIPTIILIMFVFFAILVTALALIYNFLLRKIERKMEENRNLTEGYTSCQPTIDSNGTLIGRIYPPRAGPLHTNTELNDNSGRQYVAIYDKSPFLVYHNKAKSSCV